MEDPQSILRSLHSCALLFLGRARPLSPEPASWLVCTKLSVWKLERLRPSSSVVLGDLDDADGTKSDCEPAVRPSRSAFCCWSSCVIFSTGRASRMFSAAVGRRARTVKVQSSWFCSNRRRRLIRRVRMIPFRTESRGRTLLVSRNPLNAHALSCLGQFPERILACDVAHSNHAKAHSESGTIPAQPSARGVYHPSSRYIGIETCDKGSFSKKRCKCEGRPALVCTDSMRSGDPCKSGGWEPELNPSSAVRGTQPF